MNTLLTKKIVLGTLLGLSLLALGTLFSEPEKEINPYAPTGGGKVSSDSTKISIDPNAINILSPNLGKLGGHMRVAFANYMSLWGVVRKPGASQIEWTLEVPADGYYGIIASIDGEGSSLVVSCNDQKNTATVSEDDWHLLDMGNVLLKAGENKLRFDVDAVAVTTAKADKQFRIGALELVRPATKQSLLEDALSMRKQHDWFKDAGYGLMFQWTNRATPPEGPIKAWEDKVNDFDLNGFMSTVEESGAAYVVWSVTWGNQYISAPNESLDQIIAGRTTSRDLLGEMAERLHEKGVRLIFYYHYGYECYHSHDTDWLEASGGYEGDKTKLFDNVMSIISELGNRYGDKLDGWWFDGGARYLNCHFDGSSAADGIMSAPFKAFTLAARSGNSERMVAYNSWIKPRITEYQDYYGGEGQVAFNPDELTNGVFNSGRQQGLQAHGCFTLERRWGHIDEDTPISAPKQSLQQLTSNVRKALLNRYPLSINLEMYEDGSVSPASLELMKQLKAVIR